MEKSGGAMGRETGRSRLCFHCSSCGEEIREGDECLVLRVIRGVQGSRGGVGFGTAVRFCERCAEEEDTLAGQLDMIGARYFRGPAEEAEGWESLGR